MDIENNIKINVDVAGAITETEKFKNSLKGVDVQAEKTSKSVDDVAGNGGAIAILDSLTGGLATRFKDAYEATRLFNFSLKGMRTALIATGIGALVVALGLIVAYWDEISDAIKGTTKNLEVQLDLTKSIQQNLDVQLKTIDKQLELGKLQGKSNEQLELQKVAILKRLQEQNKAETKILENQLQRLRATETEVSFWDTIAANIKFSLFGTQGLADEATRLSGERLKQIKDLQTEIDNAKLSAVDLEISLYNIDNPKQTKDAAKDTAKDTTSDDKIAQNQKDLEAKVESETKQLEEIARIRKEFADKNQEDELLKIEKEREDKLLELENITLDEVFKREAIAEVNKFYDEEALAQKQKNSFDEIALAKENADASKKISKLEADAKIGALSSYANALSSIGDLIGKETAAGKVASAASTLISTYLSAQQAYASQLSIPTPDAPIRAALAAGVAVASGLANVKAIMAVKLPKGGGGGGSAPSGGGAGGGGFTPNFNVVGASSQNQLAETVAGSTSEPTRAYVVYDDVKKAGDIESNAIAAAGI